jgi:hypothetical protein
VAGLVWLLAIAVAASVGATVQRLPVWAGGSVGVAVAPLALGRGLRHGAVTLSTE